MGVGYGAAQDKVIATSLKKFEALKPIYRQSKHRSDSLEAANTGLHQTILFQKDALRSADDIIVAKDVLYIDSNAKLYVAEKKAKSRWWLNVGLGAVCLLLGVAAIR